MTDTKTWYFIVNPRAGSGKAMAEWVPAEQKLLKSGLSFVTEMTGHKHHAAELAYQAARNGYKRIIAVGGDGSLHETLCGIGRYCDESGCSPGEFTLGVMPIGSGNDWIKSLGVPHDMDKVGGMLAEETFSTMDLVRLDFGDGKNSYMANCGGTGFDSHVCDRVNIQKEQGLRGKSIYLKALLHTVKHLSAIRVRVVADGGCVFEGECFSIALGNGKYSGSGMRQVPLADINDGLLDYMIVPKTTLPVIIKEIPRLFNGSVHESDKVLSGRCRELYIEALDDKSGDIVEVDGEIEGRLPLSIKMDGRKIRVVKG